MPTGPREHDSGSSSPGPLDSPDRAKPAAERWVTVPDKPYLQRDLVSGRLRTNGYSTETPLKD